MSKKEQFEHLAKQVEETGAGGHNKIGAGQIRAAALEDERQEELICKLQELNQQIDNSATKLSGSADKLAGGLDSVKQAVGQFNTDSGKLTKIVIIVAITSAAANVVYALTYVIQFITGKH